MRNIPRYALVLLVAACGGDVGPTDHSGGDTGGGTLPMDAADDAGTVDAVDASDSGTTDTGDVEPDNDTDAEAVDADVYDADAFDADAFDADSGDTGSESPGGCGDGVCAPDDGLCPSDCPPITPVACDDTETVGEPGAMTTETFSVTWTDVDDGYSLLDAPIVLGLPDDLTAISVTIEMRDVDTSIDRVVLNDVVLGSLYEEPARTALGGEAAAATLLLPNNELSAPVEGCLSLDVSAVGDHRGASASVTVVSRREPVGGDIAVNVLVVGDTDLSDPQVDETLAVVREIFEASGAPTLASVDVQRVEGSNIIDDVGPALNALRRRLLGDGTGLNVVFVSGFAEAGTLGFAGGIPAPPFEGTDASALVIAVDEHLDGRGERLDTQLMGETLAHEIGHQLGLFHTTESEGTSFDPLADTPQCPARLDDGDGEMSAEECLDFDGQHLMFWVAGDGISQTRVSPAQVEVMRANPLSVRTR